MMTAEASPPTKKRKLSKNKSLSCNKKEWIKSFCKQENDRKKVLEGVRDRLRNVTVAFYSPSEVAVPDKKNKKIKNGGSDFKPGDKGMSQTCYSFIKKGKEGMSEAPHASHHGHSKHRPKYSSCRCSPLSKTQNLSDLLPHSQFHSVRKRTPFACKFDHFRSTSSLYLADGHDSEPELGAQINRDTYLAIPISLGAAQRGSFSLFSKISERNVAESEIIPLCGVERKHSEKRTHSLDFKGSLLDEGGVKVRGKFARAYVRKKYRAPFSKDVGPDFYALHLLADAATNLGSGPKFEVQVQKQKGSSIHECNAHEPVSANNGSHMNAASVHRKASKSDEVSHGGKVSPAISSDNINIGSLMDERHCAKEVATNTDQNAKDSENGLIDCYNSMHAHPPTLEDVQINELNVKDAAKLSSASSKNDAYLPEHGEKNDETFVGKNDIEWKRDLKCYSEQHSVLVSKDSICHDKVSSFRCQLEPCNTCHGNSQSTLRCMETLQISEGCPRSSSTKSFFKGSWEDAHNTKACSISIRNNIINTNPGYHVRRILQSSRQKAIRMVDVAMKVISSIKVGEDAYAMIGRALDSAEIQQVVSPSKILRTQPCFNPHNGGPGNCHRDFLCDPTVAATVHLINSTVPTFTRNDHQVLSNLISACVAALLMIQASSDTRLPPAEALEILEHAERDLRPHYSQNLHIYREIEDLMVIIKTQILTFVRTPTSNHLHL